ncbi:hypothetical protein LHJ74_29025 [Streptomyces sp. N2-109]|uniref:OmpR/PhoB-type domain-containing protein n=1 Tax=Streptomyces gossypii TaxID=2883101 RepID=A0ABT2K181_9ACTN|nr:BTAD domain-containing putative transcriptional regulator [Streptomyces gossypii]MCT2593903.1 hypothetical protein [Streptomyces gossypii]
MSIGFGLLGPVELSARGRRADPGPPQRRALLSVLLLASGRAVTVATLRERIWSGTPPTSATGAIHLHVHHLRTLLLSLIPPGAGSDAGPQLLTHPGRPSLQVSYALEVADGRLDVTRFRRLLSEGALARARGDTVLALDRFDSALALWRGDPMPELRPTEFIRNARLNLCDMRADASRQRAECLLANGLLAAARDELSQLYVERPYDERVVILLSTALLRTGADGQALRLVTDALQRWQREHGLLPHALRRQRDRLMSGEMPHSPSEAAS